MIHNNQNYSPKIKFQETGVPFETSNLTLFLFLRTDPRIQPFESIASGTKGSADIWEFGDKESELAAVHRVI